MNSAGKLGAMQAIVLHPVSISFVLRHFLNAGKLLLLAAYLYTIAASYTPPWYYRPDR
ncbi:MAG: hypothetical protein R2727_03080 [Bacteroidales bacterium]